MTGYRPLLAATLLLVFFPAVVIADRLGFKGVELGSSPILLASNPKYDCKAVATPIADKVCSLRSREKETIAGEQIDSAFFFYDHTGLTGITINLPEAGFQSVVSALSEKYGVPSLKTEAVKNLKGVAYENRIFHWLRPDGSLHAERYAGRIDKSVIRYVDDTAAERNRQRRATLLKNPAQDL